MKWPWSRRFTVPTEYVHRGDCITLRPSPTVPVLRRESHRPPLEVAHDVWAEWPEGYARLIKVGGAGAVYRSPVSLRGRVPSGEWHRGPDGQMELVAVLLLLPVPGRPVTFR